MFGQALPSSFDLRSWMPSLAFSESMQCLRLCPLEKQSPEDEFVIENLLEKCRCRATTLGQEFFQRVFKCFFKQFSNCVSYRAKDFSMHFSGAVRMCPDVVSTPTPDSWLGPLPFFNVFSSARCTLNGPGHSWRRHFKGMQAASSSHLGAHGLHAMWSTRCIRMCRR